MEIKDIKAVYFVGAGGIGMSAIARYFLSKKLVVAGYDKTPSNLTHELEKEGMLIHYEENVDLIPEACKDARNTLVVYTPAIPAEHKELVYFRENGFTIEKRAQVLGTLTRTHKGLCVAGTHGKTSTSTMCAHIMHQSHLDCNAFLGGISKNYGTNYILSDKSDFVVIETSKVQFGPAASQYQQGIIRTFRSGCASDSPGNGFRSGHALHHGLVKVCVKDKSVFIFMKMPHKITISGSVRSGYYRKPVRE